jgi:hypothetical protein
VIAFFASGGRVGGLKKDPRHAWSEGARGHDCV